MDKKEFACRHTSGRSWMSYLKIMRILLKANSGFRVTTASLSSLAVRQLLSALNGSSIIWMIRTSPIRQRIIRASFMHAFDND
jgi:hypothetical protein